MVCKGIIKFFIQFFRGFCSYISASFLDATSHVHKSYSCISIYKLLKNDINDKSLLHIPED